MKVDTFDPILVLGTVDCTDTGEAAKGLDLVARHSRHGYHSTIDGDDHTSDTVSRRIFYSKWLSLWVEWRRRCDKAILCKS